MGGLPLLTGVRLLRIGIEIEWRSVHLFLGGHFAKSLSGSGSVFEGEVPGKQFVDPVDRMVGDAGQDLSEIAFGVESVEFRRADERVDGGSPFAAGVRASKQVVLSSKRDGAKRPFCRRVVDLQQTVVNVTRQRTPVRERITNRTRSLAPGRQRAKRLFHPASQLVEQRLGPCLTNRTTKFCGLAANFFFDAVQRADATDGFGGDRRSMDYVDVVKLAPGVCPTGDFIINGAALVEMMKSGVGICLQSTPEVLQM